MSSDLYAILGLPRSATHDQVRKAYRRLAKKQHPDAGGSAAQFKALQLAHTVLTNEERRAKYDETGQIDFNSIEQERAQFLELLAQAAMAVIANNFDPSQDFLSAVRSHLQQKINEGDNNAAQNNRAQKSVEAILRKLKRKKGDGALITILNNQLANIKKVVENNNQLLARVKAAHTHLQDYDYEFSSQPWSQFTSNQSFFRGFNP